MGTSKNNPCWCGSGKQFKRCHYPVDKPGTTISISIKKNNIKQRKPSFEEFAEMIGMPKTSVPEAVQRDRTRKVLENKRKGILPKPSLKFLDESKLLTQEKRAAIIDIAAKYVDENQYGRNEMCQQFAMIVKSLLKEEGIDSKIFEGNAVYEDGTLRHEWNHFWLITENDELIDGNIDSLPENPFPPEGLKPLNYWGPIANIPADRRFSQEHEFTAADETALEKQDNETVVWKKKSKQDYHDIFS